MGQDFSQIENQLYHAKLSIEQLQKLKKIIEVKLQLEKLRPLESSKQHRVASMPIRFEKQQLATQRGYLPIKIGSFTLHKKKLKIFQPRSNYSMQEIPLYLPQKSNFSKVRNISDSVSLKLKGKNSNLPKQRVDEGRQDKQNKNPNMQSKSHHFNIKQKQSKFQRIPLRIDIEEIQKVQQSLNHQSIQFENLNQIQNQIKCCFIQRPPTLQNKQNTFLEQKAMKLSIVDQLKLSNYEFVSSSSETPDHLDESNFLSNIKLDFTSHIQNLSNPIQQKIKNLRKSKFEKVGKIKADKLQKQKHQNYSNYMKLKQHPIKILYDVDSLKRQSVIQETLICLDNLKLLESRQLIQQFQSLNKVQIVNSYF